MLINIILQPIEKYLDSSIQELQRKIPIEEDSVVRFDGLIEYHVNAELHKVFFMQRECLKLSFTSKEKVRVHSVYLSFKMIDKNIFQSLVEGYGEPTSMQKMGKIKETKEFKNEIYTAKSQVGEAIDCSFEENPLFIVWDKEAYRIRISMDYGRRTSSIIFESKK